MQCGKVRGMGRENGRQKDRKRREERERDFHESMVFWPADGLAALPVGHGPPLKGFEQKSGKDQAGGRK